MPRSAPYGYYRGQFNLYIPIPAGTGAVSVVTALPLGFAFQIEKVNAVIQVAATGVGASRVFRVLKNAVVAATATLVLADGATVGDLKPFTVSAAPASVFADGDTLTVDFPTAGAVAFTAGAVILCIQYRALNQRAA